MKLKLTLNFVLLTTILALLVVLIVRDMSEDTKVVAPSKPEEKPKTQVVYRYPQFNGYPSTYYYYQYPHFSRARRPYYGGIRPRKHHRR